MCPGNVTPVHVCECHCIILTAQGILIIATHYFKCAVTHIGSQWKAV